MPTSTSNMLNRLEQCVTAHDNPIFSFNDPGTNNRFTVKTNGQRCRKVQIDGALNEVQPNKCDWCLWNYGINEFAFFELKGSNLEDAVKQLVCTIAWFKANIRPFSIYKETYIIVRQSSRIPSTESQNLRVAFRQKNKSLLQVKRSGCKLSLWG